MCLSVYSYEISGFLCHGWSMLVVHAVAEMRTCASRASLSVRARAYLHPWHVLEGLRQLLCLAARPGYPALHRGEVQVELPRAVGGGGWAQVAVQVSLAVVRRPCSHFGRVVSWW